MILAQDPRIKMPVHHPNYKMETQNLGTKCGIDMLKA